MRCWLILTTSLIVVRFYFSYLRWFLLLLFAGVIGAVYIWRDDLWGMIEALTVKTASSAYYLSSPL
jgi:TM2 domain-containing membrane protein YozV